MKRTGKSDAPVGYTGSHDSEDDQKFKTPGALPRRRVLKTRGGWNFEISDEGKNREYIAEDIEGNKIHIRTDKSLEEGEEKRQFIRITSAKGQIFEMVDSEEEAGFKRGISFESQTGFKFRFHEKDDDIDLIECTIETPEGHKVTMLDKDPMDPTQRKILIETAGGHKILMHDELVGDSVGGHSRIEAETIGGIKLLLDDNFNPGSEEHMNTTVSITTPAGFTLESQEQEAGDMNPTLDFKTGGGHRIFMEDSFAAEEPKITINTIKGHKVTMDDKPGEEKITIESQGGNKATFDDKPGSEKIELEDKTGNKITMDSMGIVVDSLSKIDLKAPAGVHQI